jgi:hypothetical protein
MRVRASITPVFGGFLAECTDYAVEGEGATVALAVEALREAIYERVLRPEAVGAPPADPKREPVEVVVTPRPPVAYAEGDGDHDLNGPGEVPPR